MKSFCIPLHKKTLSIVHLLSSVLLLLAIVISHAHAADNQSSHKKGIQWQSWQDDLFTRAQQQQRFVILDLEAVWCHWCHVMEAKTYSDPKVIALINAHYIPVRVDADANPDMASRYGRWGWPATIVFSAQGEEIVKRRGYIPTIGMVAMLQAIIDDPSPGPSVFAEPEATPANQAALSETLRKKLQATFNDFYDAEYGGWGNVHKFVNAPATEYSLEQSRLGRSQYALMARLTLHNGLNLIDPQWGGVYQYSDQKDWLSPHFEKIMFYQAENLRLYALAYARWQQADHLSAALQIYNYLETFLLAPSGGFYTSQDADLSIEVDGHDYFPLNDQQRRAKGMPRIDTNIYARENGWAIRALLSLYNASGLETARERALASAHFILSERSLPGGGFSHGSNDTGGPFLSDNQAMAQAFIALYQSSGERHWLEKATTTLDFIERTFKDNRGGYNSAAKEPASTGVFSKPIKQIDEIAALARTANIASYYTGKPRLRAIAEHAMRYLAAPELSEEFIFQPDILLADYELTHEPAHITIVGAKDDPAASALHAAARAYPGSYLRIDWWDKREGPLPNADVTYPQLDRAAAFACSDKACSLPVFKGSQIAAVVNNLYTEK